MRAGAATWDMNEWDMYQLENDFHTRTLQLMRKITQTFKAEWELYRAVSGPRPPAGHARAPGPVASRRRPAGGGTDSTDSAVCTLRARAQEWTAAEPRLAKVVTPAAAAAAAETDLFDGELRPGGRRARFAAY